MDANLTDIDKLEMINYGLDPVSGAKNHGHFFGSRVINHIKEEGNFAVIFPGCKIESHGKQNYTTFFQKPTLLNIFQNKNKNKKHKDIIQLFPFAQERGTPTERFAFDVPGEFFFDDYYRERIKMIYSSEEPGFNECVEIYFLNTDEDNAICLPNQIPDSEIHKKQIEQICNMYNLTVVEENSRKMAGDYPSVDYVLEGENRIPFRITLYNRDNTSRFPQTIPVYSGKSNINSEIKKMCNWHCGFNEPLGEEGNFEITGNSYQTYHLDQLVKKITGPRD